MWKYGAFAICVAGAAAAPEIFQAAGRAPQPLSATQAVAIAPAKGFETICRDGELPDKAPDFAWVRASYAGDGCTLAPMPAAIDGASVPREKIVAAMAEGERYGRQAAAFERCVGDFVAARGAKLTPAQRIIEGHRVLVGQKSRAAAAAQVRTAIEDFNMYGIDCNG